MSGKRILFIDAINLSPHIETSMELVDLEVKKGNKVYYYFIGHALKLPPDWGITMKRNWWNALFLPENRAARIVKPSIFKNIRRIDFQEEVFIGFNEEIKKLKNIETIKNLQFQGISIGQCVYGDYISIKKSYFVHNEKDIELVKGLIYNSIQVLNFLEKVFSKDCFDIVYIFNGRFTFAYPIMQFCKHNNIRFYIHERGSTKYNYFLEPYTPHDLRKVAERISQLNLSTPSQLSLANEFYSKKRKGINTSWVSFHQETDYDKIKFPVFINEGFVVFYTSSEFEFEAVSDQNPRNENFQTQFVAIKKIIDLSNELKFNLVIRIHPNMHSSVDFLESLKIYIGKINIHIYWPSDKINSYELLDLSKIVITYGSTIGAEAMYWGKPTILLRRSYYDYFNGLFIPQNDDELKNILYELLSGVKKFERCEMDLLKFGYYFSTFGRKFKYYIPDNNGFHMGKFLGKNLQKSWTYTKIRRFLIGRNE